jgi:hypothetical protein
MTCSWLWFIHPETAISKNRNGSSTLCVFKTHYRYRRAAVAKHRIFMQIQFSDHTGWMGDGGVTLRLGDDIGGYIAEDIVASLADSVPWFQEAIAHFYPTSTYARSLGPDVHERAAHRVFTRHE